MHINNLPAELFSEILEYIPLKDASAIMQVNRQWYQEYRGIIYRQFDNKLVVNGSLLKLYYDQHI